MTSSRATPLTKLEFSGLLALIAPDGGCQPRPSGNLLQGEAPDGGLPMVLMPGLLGLIVLLGALGRRRTAPDCCLGPGWAFGPRMNPWGQGEPLGPARDCLSRQEALIARSEDIIIVQCYRPKR